MERITKITEIIISHGKQKTFFEYKNSKIVNKKSFEIILESLIFIITL